MRQKVIVKVGDRYGRWTVLQINSENKYSAWHHLCQCDCGKKVNVQGSNLYLGKSKSCGCYAKEKTSKRVATHRMSGSVEHQTWSRMHNRCRNPNIERYERYGGRGIKVCKRWSKFENFYQDMGKRPSDKHSLGRIDNNGNYCPENCRWETDDQQRINKSNTVFYTHSGITKSLVEWSEETGVPYSVLIQRVRSKTPESKVFNTESLHDRPIYCDGETKKTTEWMRAVNIPISSFYYFRRKGFSDTEIVSKYKAKLKELQNG